MSHVRLHFPVRTDHARDVKSAQLALRINAKEFLMNGAKFSWFWNWQPDPIIDYEVPCRFKRVFKTICCNKSPFPFLYVSHFFQIIVKLQRPNALIVFKYGTQCICNLDISVEYMKVDNFTLKCQVKLFFFLACTYLIIIRLFILVSKER